MEEPDYWTDEDCLFISDAFIWALRHYCDFKIEDEKHPFREIDKDCLKEAIEMYHLPQKDIAALMGIKPPTLSAWLKNPGKMPISRAQDLVYILSVAGSHWYMVISYDRYEEVDPFQIFAEGKLITVYKSKYSHGYALEGFRHTLFSLIFKQGERRAHAAEQAATRMLGVVESTLLSYSLDFLEPSQKQSLLNLVVEFAKLSKWDNAAILAAAYKEQLSAVKNIEMRPLISEQQAERAVAEAEKITASTEKAVKGIQSQEALNNKRRYRLSRLRNN